MAIASINPATGETVRTYTELSDRELEQKLQLATETFRTYRQTSYSQRAELLRRTADVLDADADRLAGLATLEMGKTLASAVAEIQKCVRGCRWYADHGADLLADERYEVAGARVFTRYEPLGPVLAVMPWNFPYWQVFRFIAPALMAGNVGLLKHASNVPQVALAIEETLRQGGFAEGVFQTLLIGSGKVATVIDDDRVRAVTLTGSEPAGRQVGASAGKNIKPSVLELGGADAFVVMPSADLDQAVENAVASRMLNNAQSCINAKRFIVHTHIAEEFTRRMVEKLEALRIGDPTDPDTDLGPLSSADGVDTLDEQVQGTVKAGARLLTGGARLDRPGNYYPPTVLTDIPDDSPGHHEEFFGPVALIWRANDIDDAIRIANDSPFGLGGSAWTNDPGEQERFANEIETGMIYINKMTESTPEVPFGGAKNSGYGRELAQFGARSFVNAKTVWFNGS